MHPFGVDSIPQRFVYVRKRFCYCSFGGLFCFVVFDFDRSDVTWIEL